MKSRTRPFLHWPLLALVVIIGVSGCNRQTQFVRVTKDDFQFDFPRLAMLSPRPESGASIDLPSGFSEVYDCEVVFTVDMARNVDLRRLDKIRATITFRTPDGNSPLLEGLNRKKQPRYEWRGISRCQGGSTARHWGGREPRYPCLRRPILHGVSKGKVGITHARGTRYLRT